MPSSFSNSDLEYMFWAGIRNGSIGTIGTKGDPGGIIDGTVLIDASLDTYTASGVYRQSSSAGTFATLANNYPYNGAYGTLLVLKTSGNDITQVFFGQTYAGGADGRGFWRRNWSNNTWSPWRFHASQRFDTTAGRAMYIWNELQNTEQLIYGDTGLREISGLLNANWTLSEGTPGNIWLRRTNNMVTVTCQRLTRTSAGITVLTLPDGFRPDNESRGTASTLAATPTVHSFLFRVPGTWDFEASVPTLPGVNFTHQFVTSNPWPTSLPGTAVGSIPTGL